MDCYRCGQEGHPRSECPERWPARRPAVRATPTAAQPVRAPRPLPDRDEIPHRPGFLSVACPWCLAALGQACTNVGTGQNTAPHQARRDLVIDAVPGL